MARYRPYINLRAPLPGAADLITIRVSRTGQMALALDDPALVREAYPTLSETRYNRLYSQYAVSREDARTVCDDLYERASPAAEGFGEAPNTRAACHRDAARIYDQLYPAHKSS